jgi:hypothetical protein
MSRVLPRLILTALLVLSLTACEGGTLLFGTITDKAGKPVASAAITLEVIDGPFNREKEYSNEQGAYRIQVTHYPQPTYLVVTVSKDGFEPFKKKFRSKGVAEHLDVTLEAADVSGLRASQ